MSQSLASFVLGNNNLGENDFLYHIGLSTSDNLEKRFGDVYYVCMGGTGSRMRQFAQYMYERLDQPENSEVVQQNGHRVLKNVSEGAHRYALYKVGPIIFASHGIGIASLSVVLNEIFKLLHYAKCMGNVEFFRLGTSGGLGLQPGTVVLTEKSYDSQLRPYFQQVCCGKVLELSSNTDESLSKTLYEAAQRAGVTALIGNTMTTDDFFEGQGRIDGAFCEVTLDDKMKFLRKIHDECGIKNIEMESLCFIAMCNRAGIKCAVACVTLLNRLEGDQVGADKDLLETWQKNLFEMMAEYIKPR